MTGHDRTHTQWRQMPAGRGEPFRQLKSPCPSRRSLRRCDALRHSTAGSDREPRTGLHACCVRAGMKCGLSGEQHALQELLALRDSVRVATTHHGSTLAQSQHESGICPMTRRVPEECPQSLCDLIARCMLEDPALRPSAKEVHDSLKVILACHRHCASCTRHTRPQRSCAAG